MSSSAFLVEKKKKKRKRKEKIPTRTLYIRIVSLCSYNTHETRLADHNAIIKMISKCKIVETVISFFISFYFLLRVNFFFNTIISIYTMEKNEDTVSIIDFRITNDCINRKICFQEPVILIYFAI